MHEKFVLHGVKCAFESQQIIVCDCLVRSKPFIENGLSNLILTPANLTALAYVISTSSHPVRSVDITNCGLIDDPLTAFILKISIEKLKKYTKFGSLSYDKIISDGVKIVASALKYCYKLENLGLNNNNIGSNGTIALSGKLKSCARLKILRLLHNNIGPEGAQALAGAVKSCKNMEKLFLSYNKIGPDGTQVHS